MIGMKELLIVLVVVLLVFGTKKLRSLGGDLGSSLKDFKKAMGEGDDSAKNNSEKEDAAKKEKIVNEALDDKTEDKS